MKKLLCLFLTFSFLLLTSCAANKKDIVYKTNMLKFSSEDNTFQGIKARYFDILKVISTEITTLEKAYNDNLKNTYPKDYFLSDEYLHYSFNPFDITAFSLTDNFTDNLLQENAEMYYGIEAGGRNIIVDSTEESYTLKFSSEKATDIYTVDYKANKNTFRFIHNFTSPSEDYMVEFIEFSQIGSNAYYFQSDFDRCYINFDDVGHIISFYYSSLNPNAPTHKVSIYGNNISEISAKNWVFDEPKQNYYTIVEFNNGKLKHTDNSSGESKTVEINEADFEIAFY